MDSMHSLAFVTGNELKFEVAVRALQNSDISLERVSLDVPEIQSTRVEEIADWSAVWAGRQLNRPVAVTDAGYSFEALNGFPGPFIKYVNQWFSASDYLHLMQGKSNRRVIIQDCLAYCLPGTKPVLFNHRYQGELATKAGRPGATPIDQVFIPEGFSNPISEIPPEEMLAYCSQGTVWAELERYLKKSLT